MPSAVMIRRLLVKTKDLQYELPIQNIGNQVNPQRPSRAGRHNAKLDDNVLTLSLSVERRKTTRFHLTFQEALERRNSMYTHTLYLNLTYNVRKFDLQYLIYDAREIAFLRPLNKKKADVYSEGKFTEQGFSRECLESFKRIDGYMFKMNCSNDRKLKNPAFMIGLEYDVMREQNGNNFIVKDNQFVHSLDLGNLSSSSCRDVVFILDVLDGMSQAVQQDILAAMISILDQMGSDDRVDYITTGESPQTLNKMATMFRALDDELRHGLQHFLFKSFLRSQNAGRGNIEGAFRSAKIKFAQANSRFRSCVPLIVLISCGSSLDERNDMVNILEEVGAENTENFPIFCLLLKRFNHFTFFERLSNENYGFVTKIYDTSEVKPQIIEAYEEIARKATINVTMLYSPYIKTTTQPTFPFVLNGTEKLICGEFKHNRSTIWFQFHVKYKNGRGDRYDSRTLFDTGHFHQDTTTKTLKMLCLHVLVKEWLANYHRLTAEKRQELENILIDTIAQEQLLIPSLTQSRLVRATSQTLAGLHFSQDGSVATAELSIGASRDHTTNTTPLQDPKQPASGKNRKQSWRRTCRRSKSIRHVVLSVIAMSIPRGHLASRSKRGVCMFPRKWACDFYVNLVEYTNGTDVFLAQDNRKKKTLKAAVHPNILYVRENRPGSNPSAGHHTIIFLGGESKWTLVSQEPSHEARKPSRNEITISTPTLKITLKRVCKRRVMLTSIHISPGRSFDVTKLTGGLLATFINMKKGKVQKFAVNRAKKVCKRNGLSSSLVAIMVGTNGSNKFCKRTL